MTATTQATPLTRGLVLGSWRMISWTYKVVETGETRDALGQNPRGSIVYTPERVMVLVLKSDRKRPLELPRPGVELYDLAAAGYSRRATSYSSER